jgi:hypothetical protein
MVNPTGMSVWKEMLIVLDSWSLNLVELRNFAMIRRVFAMVFRQSPGTHMHPRPFPAQSRVLCLRCRSFYTGACSFLLPVEYPRKPPMRLGSV